MSWPLRIATLSKGVGVYPPFLTAATDTYARSLVTGIKIESGESDTYFLNYETVTYAGIPLSRIKFHLWSVGLGALVATWTKQDASQATLLASLPPTINLTQVSNGAIQAGYAGIEATLTLDWTKIVMTKALSTYTTVAATGIHSGNIYSSARMDDFLGAPSIKGTLTVGSGQTYATVAAAFAAMRNGVTPLSRSTYPNSDICTYSNQKLIQVAAGHDELITSFNVGGVDNGQLIPHYATLDIPATARLRMNGANTAPVLEAPHSCRIRGLGTIEQFGDGYGIHIDNVNTLSVAGAASFQRYRLRTVIEDVTIRHHGTASNAAMIGMGISDGQTLICRRVQFIREGVGTSPLVIIHTSPSCINPGLIVFEDCYFNDALITGAPDGIQLLKSNVQTARHKIRITNTTISKVTAGNSVGGNAGWVRDGAFDPSITYTATLDP